MIIATETTSQSLQITLSDHTFLQALTAAREDIRLFRPDAFKRDIEAFIGGLAYAVSQSIARPKGRDFSTDGSLLYLAMDVLDDPEFYGRISFFFQDKKYSSIDVGTRLYNELIKRLSVALEAPFLTNLYIRNKPPLGKEDNEVKQVINVGGISVELAIIRECALEDGYFYPKMFVSFLDVDDPKAMCKLVLVDGFGKAKTRPIIFQLSGKPVTKKAYFFEIGPNSLGPHSHALLGARVTISHREVEVRNGKTVTSVITDSDEAMMDVYLIPNGK